MPRRTTSTWICWRISSCLCFVLAFIVALATFANSQTIIGERAKRGILRIENPEGKLGTGFIVFDSLRVLLLTNKHVVKSCETQDYFDYVYLRKNELRGDGHVMATQERSKLYLRFKGKNLFLEHEDPNVDLLVILLGRVIVDDETFENPPNFFTPWIYGFDISKVASEDDMSRLGIGVGTSVQIVGFSYQHLKEPQFHISRFGHIALATKEVLKHVFRWECGDTTYSDTLSSVWLLIDITSRGGDSGGPVVAAESKSKESRLVGVVKGGTDVAEICFAIPSRYILELVESVKDRYRRDNTEEP